jgi:hypothetical protein
MTEPHNRDQLPARPADDRPRSVRRQSSRQPTNDNSVPFLYRLRRALIWLAPVAALSILMMAILLAV